jgi:hypothetical protein
MTASRLNFFILVNVFFLYDILLIKYSQINDEPIIQAMSDIVNQIGPFRKKSRIIVKTNKENRMMYINCDEIFLSNKIEIQTAVKYTRVL